MKLLYSAQRMADALGVKPSTIYAIRRAAKYLKDPVPRYVGPEAVVAWLNRHPEFVPHHWLQPKRGMSGRQRTLAYKLSEQQRMNAQPTPSPASQGIPVERVA